METSFVDSTDGVRVALHSFGGSGPPLLICHATGFHGRAYLPLARALAANYSVSAIDFRGQGASNAPDSGNFAWTAMAQDLLACHQEIADGPILAVGHSMGGSAILLAEMAQPGTIAGAYLYEPIVFPQARIEARGENPMAGPARKRRAAFPTKQAALERYGSRPPLGALDPEALALYVEHGFVIGEDGQAHLSCTPEHEARIFEAEDKMTLERLSGFELTTTVAVGTMAEEMSPAALAPAIVDAIVGGRMVDYPDLGHFGPLQDPGRIAKDIIDAFR